MCKILGKLIERFKSYKNFRFGGLPQTESKNLEILGGICSACRGLSGDIKMPGKFCKIKEISGVKEKPFRPLAAKTEVGGWKLDQSAVAGHEGYRS